MGKFETASFLLIVALGFLMVQSSDGFIHVVGASSGWCIPPNKTFYQEWAKPRTFGLHDELVFPYKAGGHTVHQVNKKDFEDCTHEHVISQTASGATRFKLKCLGDYYFYSAVGLHCEMGQKLHVNVVDKPGSDNIDWKAITDARKRGAARKMLTVSDEDGL